MDVVVLVSGGKDSITSACIAVALGHRIAALANLRPDSSNERAPSTGIDEELDSHMFQTVGTASLVPAIARQCWRKQQDGSDVPFFTADLSIQDCMRDNVKSNTLHYDHEANPDAEIEIMFNLIKRVVQNVPSIRACVSGAILSNYQRLRVESVCQRLGLISLAPLWRIDQSRLLDFMIDIAKIDAVLMKTACYGLQPRKLLGRSIAEARSVLGITGNPCGEGGEYETIVLSCPLFRSKIVIRECEVVGHRLDNPWDPCGHLQVNCFQVLAKSEDEEKEDKETMEEIRQWVETELNQANRRFVLQEAACTNEISRETRVRVDILEEVGDKSFSTGSNVTRDGFMFCASSPSESLCDMVNGWKTEAARQGYQLKNAVTISLFVPAMSKFGAINQEYVSFFGLNPPSRCCVEVPSFLSDSEFRGDCLFAPLNYERSSLHVQSISSWAPACIGPYSQATECWPSSFAVERKENENEPSQEIVKSRFFAGQIALDPLTMTLDKSQSLVDEFERSIQHLCSVSKCLDSAYGEVCSDISGFDFANILSAVAFCAPNASEVMVKAWQDHKGSQLDWLIIEVPHLPRAARVETQFVSVDFGVAVHHEPLVVQSAGRLNIGKYSSGVQSWLRMTTCVVFTPSEGITLSGESYAEIFDFAEMEAGSSSIIRIYFDVNKPSTPESFCEVLGEYLMTSRGLVASFVPCLGIALTSDCGGEAPFMAIQTMNSCE
eukprot:TRINITY_DN18304_c0_g1_i1.p1 TRINITY_DN18304_c0_g1~~TRINITY_DN18304_c0_g1_i1.p1  ORF type:complete len:729 (+),score=136.27 TRINITY_DN18304_c0_g1_i1:27-2189(+)